RKKHSEAPPHQALCRYQLDAGDYRGAAQTVAAWTQSVPADRAQYHQAALCLVRCSALAAAADSKPEGGRLAESFARDAVKWLRQAAQRKTLAGPFLQDAAFDPLRDRDDFKEVLRSLAKP